MSAGLTDILQLPVYDNTDDIDYNELNTGNQQLDRLPPTFCLQAARPTTNLYNGRLIWETDTKRLLIYDLAADKWRQIGTDMELPVPVRGYIINTVKNITATAFTDVTSDFVKSMTCPRDCMVNIMFRTLQSGVAGTAVTSRLAWTGATTGDTYNQMDSALLGSNRSFAGGQIDTHVTSVLLGAGITTFKVQSQRSNTSNAVTVDAAALAITPIAWGDEYLAGAN